MITEVTLHCLQRLDKLDREGALVWSGSELGCGLVARWRWRFQFPASASNCITLEHLQYGTNLSKESYAYLLSQKQ